MVDSEVLLSEALLDIERASDEKSLDSLRVQYLGKKGSLGYKEGTYWGSCKDIQFKKGKYSFSKSTL